VLFDGAAAELLALQRALAARPGPIVPVFCARPDGAYPIEFLRRETVVSCNTTAAGGNANLMMIDALHSEPPGGT
jgi:RHH-type proline utilization regulon transcriptional repressor/proline dehydrogenase/delta 1-pyrroline-5-carboxylate dehydrogenase